ncbi:threonine-phosphate decarboxylase CobD [Mesorhizobium sp. LHD-90]|uniref:threonine-phosphate decarboxylase CobD n=1 Tax=Mesorhizobium sp. LHD-90 TaxID=3071414 RepID=UPI0027DFE2C7|nr:threonine-phosphate decarboxylase CobD [Mesorhizobium sp. LHD-90]MDQ6438225.1 threonine-phosphate decarboxylase CobD [Mesorhizobium sp. LHD-90]
MTPGLAEKIGAVDDHGGSLGRARALFPQAPQPFVDLSTGINPHSYPLFDLPATAFTRLPEAARLEELKRVAAKAYGVPDAANVAAAPGTQILLPLVMALVPPGRAKVLGPTYAEHARAAALAGHEVEEVNDFNALFEADVGVIVNPNNPDGKVMARQELLALAERLAGRGGLLVVDEAFMDVGPRAESVAGDVRRPGLVVLRSFGKFFGLAGVRLGFVLAEQQLAARLESALGPWAVSGPALEMGNRALADLRWQETMRSRLADEAERLDKLLKRFGLSVTGGTTLYRLVETPEAPELFEALGRSGILVRNFGWSSSALRFGLPGDEAAWKRLKQALTAWRNQNDFKELAS